jgi:SAM-dependent methyltransferase
MTSNYDRIARFYDVDMARNMRFDDVAFYAHQCARAAGPVLELGCGNGRIVLPLAQRGMDVVGIDASASMLAQLAREAAARRVPLRAVRGDARRLPFRAGFSVVLCPYSLVTYMTSDADTSAMICGAREVLAPRGLVVVDAFVPRAVAAQAEFSLDYERPFGVLTLVRRKRISPLPGGVNRIERRYELRRSDGRIAETIDVAETIRPRAPGELREVVTRAGFAVVDEAWDYATRPGPDGAQFYTLVARKT